MSSALEHTNQPELPQTGREKRITKRVRHAINLWVSGKAANRKIAAEQAGISPEHFYRTLAMPHVRAHVDGCFRRALEDLRITSVGQLTTILTAGKSETVRATIGLRALARELAPEGGPVVSITNNAPGYVINLGSPDACPTLARTIEGKAEPLTAQGIEAPSPLPTEGMGVQRVRIVSDEHGDE
jgi:hypothetical protein